MRTAACYIRVSTDDQLEYSPDSQLKLIQDYAEKNDIVLLEDCIFIEESGISGKSMDKRPEFMRMIALSKKKPKPFDAILVWKFSRFTRNQQESIVLKAMLKKNGIDVVSISEPLPEGPFGSLVETIISWQDQYYLTNLSQEVKRGMKERASRGEPVAPPPIGYDSKDGKYIPNENAPLVRDIFNDYLNGIGMRTIAIKYSNLGMRTKRGNPLDNRAIEYMLRNPVYIGKIRWSVGSRAASTRHYDDPSIMISDGKHEPIVDKEIFDAVQKKIDEQKQMYGKYQRSEQPFEWMLKGLVRCSACGSTLILIQTKSPSLQCHSYAKGACHTSHSITLEKANAAVIEYLENAALSGEFSLYDEKGKIRSESRINYRKLIENERAKLNRIKLAYQKGIDTLEEYAYNKGRILDAVSKLEAAATAEVPPLDKAAYCKRILDVLKVVKNPKETESAKNSALRTVVRKIVFSRSANRFEVYFY